MEKRTSGEGEKKMVNKKDSFDELARAITAPPANRLYKTAVYLYNMKPDEYSLEYDYLDDGIFKSYRLLDKKTKEVLIDWALYEKLGKPIL